MVLYVENRYKNVELVFDRRTLQPTDRLDFVRAELIRALDGVPDDIKLHFVADAKLLEGKWNRKQGLTAWNDFLEKIDSPDYLNSFITAIY